MQSDATQHTAGSLVVVSMEHWRRVVVAVIAEVVVEVIEVLA
jgi:hypothetical protein